MKRIACLATFGLVLLTACETPIISIVVTPTPTRRLPPTPRMTATPSYIGPVKSPDGRTLATLVCHSVSMYSSCTTRFPNGHYFSGSPGAEDWSPDNNYVVVGVGGDHDSPPIGFQAWDMVNGEMVRSFHDFDFGWDPSRPHTLVYVVVNDPFGAALGEIIEIDASTKAEKHLTACPDWIQHGQDCTNFSGSIIGGQISGLLDNAKATTLVYSQDYGIVVEEPAWIGDASWKIELTKHRGLSYWIIPQAEGYIGAPISYTVQISGTEAYMVENGMVTSAKADHLDFHFEKTNLPVPTFSLPTANPYPAGPPRPLATVTAPYP